MKNPQPFRRKDIREMNIEEDEECICFIDINEFNNDTNGVTENIWWEISLETSWKEMSWNKYKDNLFDYLEDN